jgi:hypothetical protein
VRSRYDNASRHGKQDESFIDAHHSTPSARTALLLRMSRTPFAIFGCPRRYRDRRRDNVRGILQEHPFGGVKKLAPPGRRAGPTPDREGHFGWGTKKSRRADIPTGKLQSRASYFDAAPRILSPIRLGHPVHRRVLPIEEEMISKKQGCESFHH